MLDHILGEKSQWFWAMAQFLAVVISLIFIYRQIRLHRQGNMLQAIARHDQKWGSQEFISYRIVACQRYQETLKIGRAEGALLDFFEDLSIYLKRGVYDKDLIWEKYSYFIEYYWLMYDGYIAEFRAKDDDNSWYDQFQSLNTEMGKLAKKKNIKYGGRTKDEIDLFLKGEKEQEAPNNDTQPNAESGS